MDLKLKTIQELYYDQIRELTLRTTRLDMLGDKFANQLLNAVGLR